MQITIPHNFKPRAYQVPLLRAMDNGCKRAVIVWNRRSGKDKTCLNITIKKMLERVGNYYYFLPTYSQAKKIVWEGKDKEGVAFLDHFPKEITKKKDDSALQITLTNGSIFQLIGTDNVDSIVGTNPVGCVFSEYSLQSDTAWSYIRPILAENGGWAIFNFTPRGRNHAWKILQQAREDNWFSEVLTVEQTLAIDHETLEEERKQMPSDLFRQEYYCEFLEDAGAVFKSVDAVVYDRAPEWHRDKRYQLGIDLAKFQDFTVLTPIDLHDFKVIKPDRFNQIDYTLQKAKIETHYYRYNKPRTFIDSTGVGEPIYDDLVERGLVQLNPYSFTETSRRNLLTNLQILIEQRIIKLPPDETLLNELKSCHYELGNHGKVKIEVPEGLHDDTVMSLALACWDLPSEPLKLRTQEDRELLKQFEAYHKPKRYSLTR